MNPAFNKKLKEQIAHDLFEFDAEFDAENNNSDVPDYRDGSTDVGETKIDKEVVEHQTLLSCSDDAFRANVAALLNRGEVLYEVVAEKVKEMDDRLNTVESLVKTIRNPGVKI
jgi:hypothetical protein